MKFNQNMIQNMINHDQINPPARAVAVSKLDCALDSLDSASVALHHAINSLEERLASLLEPAGDNKAGPGAPACGTDDPLVAPMIAKIENQTITVGSAADRIGTLLSRLCA